MTFVKCIPIMMLVLIDYAIHNNSRRLLIFRSWDVEQNVTIVISTKNILQYTYK